MKNKQTKTEYATFGAGCFWSVEELFREQPGVLSTAVGYMGGTTAHPTSEEVYSDATGHVEVVQMVFNPNIITYQSLLTLFWKNHNPTTLNRQGPDIGSQYRSVIFFHSAEQQAIAKQEKKKLEASKLWGKPIVTTIEPASTFWRAEEYHQQFLAKRGKQSCHF